MRRRLPSRRLLRKYPEQLFEVHWRGEKRFSPADEAQTLAEQRCSINKESSEEHQGKGRARVKGFVGGEEE